MRTLNGLEEASRVLQPAGRALAHRDLAGWPRDGRARAAATLDLGREDPDPSVRAVVALERDALRAAGLREVLAAPEPEFDPYLRLAGATLRKPERTPESLRDSLSESLAPLRGRLLEAFASGEDSPELLEVLGALGGDTVVAALLAAAEASGAPRGDLLAAAYRAGGPGPVASATAAALASGREPGLLLLAGSKAGCDALLAAAGAGVDAAGEVAWACRDLAPALALPILRRLVDRPEEVLVAHALCTVETWTDPAGADLARRALAKAESADLRGRALRILANLGQEDAATLALRALKLGPDPLRQDAFEALAVLGFDAREKRRRVAGLAESRDLNVAAAALISLSVRAPREVTQGPLRRLVAQGEEASLLVAARCLGYLPSPSSRLLLERLARLDSPLVSFEAVRALGRHPREDSTTESLKSLLVSREVPGRAAAAAALVREQHVGDVEVIEALRRYWDEDRAGRAEGLRSLGALSRGELAPLLAEVAWNEERELAEPALDGLLALRTAPPEDVLRWSGAQPEPWRRARAALARWSGGETRALEDLLPLLLTAEAPEARTEACRALRDAALLVRHVPELPGLAPLRRALALQLAPASPRYQPPPRCEVDETLAEIELPRELTSAPELGAFLDLSARELARLYRKAPQLVSEYRLAVMVLLLVVAQLAGLALRRRGGDLVDAPVLGRAGLTSGEGLALLAVQGGRWTAEGGAPRPLVEDSAPLRPPGSLAASEGESVRVVAGPVEGNHVTLVGPGELAIGEVEAKGPSEFDYQLRLEPRAGTTRLRATWGRPDLTIVLGESTLRVGRAVLDIVRTSVAAPTQVTVYWGSARLDGPTEAGVELEPGNRYVFDDGGGLEAIPLADEKGGSKP